MHWCPWPSTEREMVVVFVRNSPLLMRSRAMFQSGRVNIFLSATQSDETSLRFNIHSDDVPKYGLWRIGVNLTKDRLVTSLTPS